MIKELIYLSHFLVMTINIIPQSNVNPDISLIGTFNIHTNFNKGMPGYGKLNFDTPEMEMFVESYLNPYSKAAAAIAFEDGEFGVEELYAEVVRGLPLDVQIKAGKYLVGFGKLNTLHPHAWQFLERPLYHQVFLGSEGFNDIGVNLSFILPTTSFYSNLDVGVFKGDAISGSEASDPEDQASLDDQRGINPIFVGRLGSFFSIGDYSNLEVGLSGSYGYHAFGDIMQSEMIMHKAADYFYTGIDFKYKYNPDKYSTFIIQGEGILNSREVFRDEIDDNVFDQTKKINTYGAIFYFDYFFSGTYSIGAKYDYTAGLIGDEPSYNTLSNDDQNSTQGISGWLGYYPIEHTLAVRLGIEHLLFHLADGSDRPGETMLKLQLVFSMGPHKAHPF